MIRQLPKISSAMLIHALFILSVGFFSPLILWSQPSASDKYCAYLQEMQARALQEKQDLSAIESLINFVNDLTQKITLDNLEKDALSKKMTFEEFQKWANDAHSVKVNDHYKAKYLKRYIKNVCGEIMYSATFSATPEPEASSTAEKQFDPTGYPYSAEVTQPSTSAPTPASLSPTAPPASPTSSVPNAPTPTSPSSTPEPKNSPSAPSTNPSSPKNN